MSGMVVSPISNLVHCSCTRNITPLLARVIQNTAVLQASLNIFNVNCAQSYQPYRACLERLLFNVKAQLARQCKLCTTMLCERSMASYTLVTGYLTVERNTMSPNKKI